MNSHRIRKGDLVEFTDIWIQNYPPARTELIRFGIAVEDEDDTHSAKVMIKDGSIVKAPFVYAYGWAGWIPEELKKVVNEFWAKLEKEEDDG